MNITEAKEIYAATRTKMEAVIYAMTLANWDVATRAPAKGKPYAAKYIGIMSGEWYSLSTSPEMLEAIEVLSYNSDALDPVLKREIELKKESIDKLKKIPADEYQEYCELEAISQVVWEEAKAKQDFEIFRPNLEKIVDYKRRYAAYINPAERAYNVLLDDYEKGMTTDDLDKFFAELRSKAVPLLKRIREHGRSIDNSFNSKSYDAKCQEEISYKVLDLMKFDLEGGVLALSEHPFTTEINEGDVRLTTHFYENNLISGFFSTMHEAGHGLYEQHAKSSEMLKGSALMTGTSMSIHESQSRFYENLIGRSYGFWQYFYPTMQEKFPEQLKDVSLDQFYAAANMAEPGLIRTEADELTYNLHIMVRYELEKELIEGRISVAELPERWSEKYQEYLGVTPQNVAQGVLQDVHWSGGMFGYFPSYALGNAYAAQLLNTMSKTLDVDALCRKGDLTPINNWLNEHVHQYGAYKTPQQVIFDATGEGLNPTYLTDYLEQKYEHIYF